MKMHWIRSLTLGAAALALASTAWAEISGVAEVPFSFAIKGRQMPAGRYTIRQTLKSDPHSLYLTNGREGMMLTGFTAGYGDKDGARLVFSCRESEPCALREIWDGTGSGLAFPAKPNPAEKERIAVISVHRAEAE